METEITGILAKINAALEALGVVSPQAFETLVRAEALGGLVAMWVGVLFATVALICFISGLVDGYNRFTWMVFATISFLIGAIMGPCGYVSAMTAEAKVIKLIMAMVPNG